MNAWICNYYKISYNSMNETDQLLIKTNGNFAYHVFDDNFIGEFGVFNFKDVLL